MRYKWAEFHGRRLDNNVFVETGTFEGESLANALDMRYRTLLSCDINRTNIQFGHLYTAAARQGKQLIIKRAESPDFLAYETAILRNYEVTFWLDAHYQGGPKTECSLVYGECPLLNELKAIFASPWRSLPIILIDDAHMFHEWPMEKHGVFSAEQWPTYEQIVERFPTNAYAFSEEEDVIWCLPK